MGYMRNQETDLLFEAMLSLNSVDEFYRFFEDVCTIKEIQSLSQRFLVACELDAGKNYLEVYQRTGVSTATISRVNKCLQYGDGGYQTALQRLKEKGVLKDGTE